MPGLHPRFCSNRRRSTAAATLRAPAPSNQSVNQWTISTCHPRFSQSFPPARGIRFRSAAARTSLLPVCVGCRQCPKHVRPRALYSPLCTRKTLLPPRALPLGRRTSGSIHSTFPRAEQHQRLAPARRVRLRFVLCDVASPGMHSRRLWIASLCPLRRAANAVVHMSMSVPSFRSRPSPSRPIRVSIYQQTAHLAHTHTPDASQRSRLPTAFAPSNPRPARVGLFPADLDRSRAACSYSIRALTRAPDV